ncbi:purine-nucleoside phosphorylase, partial [Trinickia symbiotica]
MYDKIMESVEYINSKVNRKPKIAVILGTGLGDLVSEVKEVEEIPYENIPNFPVSTVKGHEGKLVFGKINGIEVMLMQGRFHYYEGYTMKEVTYPIYVMKKLGIEKIVVTNACGGINKSFEPGTLMIIN